MFEPLVEQMSSLRYTCCLSWCLLFKFLPQFVHSHEFHLPSTMKSAQFVFVITNFLITLPYKLVVLKVLLNRRNTLMIIK